MIAVLELPIKVKERKEYGSKQIIARNVGPLQLIYH